MNWQDSTSGTCGGPCPAGKTCQVTGNLFECSCVTTTPCGSMAGPGCGGGCPPGQGCFPAAPGGCVCQLSCMHDQRPYCGGSCFAGKTCKSYSYRIGQSTNDLCGCQ